MSFDTTMQHQLALGGFKPLRTLGSGTFGTVYLCFSNAVRQLRCVKAIRMQPPGKTPAEHQIAVQHQHMVHREIYLLRNLQHPRIVRFDEYFEIDDHVFIVMGYEKAGNLQQMIDRKLEKYQDQPMPFDAQLIVRHFCDLLVGLEYLHLRHVIHRDLKPENILIGEDGRLKIADFGIAKIHVDDADEPIAQPGTGGGATPLFMAPESLLTHQFGFETDIWALGCVLFELCTLRSPFAGCHNWQEIYRMACGKAYGSVRTPWTQRRWPQSCGDGFQTLIDGCLEPKAQRRASIGWLVRQPVLTQTFYRNYFEYDDGAEEKAAGI